MKRVAVVGGGAAGFFAAIRIAEKNPKAEVVIYESTGKLLSKVLVSGGGRCNVTNSTFDNSELLNNYPRGKKELRGPFSRFAVQDTIDWFSAKNIQLKTEPDNRMFPISNSSKTIADCLINSAKEHGILIKPKHKVISIEKKDYYFFLRFKNTEEERFCRVILATGGSRGGYKLAESLGHTIIKPVPSLFTFEIDAPLIENLAGLSFENVSLELRVNKTKFSINGPILITHWGLSGPAIIKLSALGARELFDTNYQAELKVNFLTEFNSESLVSFLSKLKLENGKKKFKTITPFTIPKRFWYSVLELSGVDLDTRISDATKKQFFKIAEILTHTLLKVAGKGVFKEEFVTAGGVKLKEVDFKTMQSKIVTDLYFAGEVLNIDGITGGFNFQNAWTTGWIVGSG